MSIFLTRDNLIWSLCLFAIERNLKELVSYINPFKMYEIAYGICMPSVKSCFYKSFGTFSHFLFIYKLINAPIIKTILLACTCLVIINKVSYIQINVCTLVSQPLYERLMFSSLLCQQITTCAESYYISFNEIVQRQLLYVITWIKILQKIISI